MKVFLTTLFLVAALNTLACRAAATEVCPSATSTKHMVACLKQLLGERERALENLESRLKDSLHPTERLPYEQSQLAWHSFRLANCTSASSLYADGSMEPIVFLSCMKEMTQDRIRDVQQVFKIRLQ